MGNKERKKARRALELASRWKVGWPDLILALLFVAATCGAVAVFSRWWSGGEDPDKIIAYANAAAEQCLAFLAARGTPQFSDPDALQAKRPHRVYFVEHRSMNGDHISTKTAPITFFLVKSVKWDTQAWKKDHKLQPSYVVDVVLWPDMVYLAHKEIFSAHADYWVRSHRTPGCKRLVEGKKTALDKWLADRLRVPR